MKKKPTMRLFSLVSAIKRKGFKFKKLKCDGDRPLDELFCFQKMTQDSASLISAFSQLRRAQPDRYAHLFALDEDDVRSEAVKSDCRLAVIAVWPTTAGTRYQSERDGKRVDRKGYAHVVASGPERPSDSRYAHSHCWLVMARQKSIA
jgi:hypothetical protein